MAISITRITAIPYCVRVSLPMAYSLLILERLVLCQCYRDNSFPGGVHVFLQRPSEIIKRGRVGVASDLRSESVRREYAA